MTAPLIFGAMVALAVVLAIAGGRVGWLKLPRRRVRHPDLDAQIAADYPPEQRAEARAIVDAVLAHAHPDQHERVWRSMLDGTRGDLAHLRRVQPKAIESLGKLYRMLGGGPGTANAPPSPSSE
ncbi:MAG TPA: hypothetical protein VFS20_21585 [Longimicrobium sp.]|nr:hypothetical protein [Longimicrobium sp.]